jgi:hypothetical protein
MAEFTTTQIQEAIAEAIKERAFEDVRSLLEYLAVQDPQAATDTLETIKLGMAVAALNDGSQEVPDA